METRSQAKAALAKAAPSKAGKKESASSSRRTPAKNTALVPTARKRSKLALASAAASPTTLHYDPTTRTGVPLALGMTRADVRHLMGGPPQKDFGDGRAWYFDSTLLLEFDPDDRLRLVTVNTDLEQKLSLVVGGRDLARMPRSKVCALIRNLDPDAETDGEESVTSNRLGLSAWTDVANQFDPAAPASQVSYWRVDSDDDDEDDYDTFMKNEIPRLKANDKSLDHRSAFKQARVNWQKRNRPSSLSNLPICAIS